MRYQGRKVRLRRRGVVRLRLRELLRERGMTGYALAKYTQLSLNTVYRLMRPSGRFRLIRADTMERLCAALRITPADLFEYEKPVIPQRASDGRDKP